MRSLGIALFRYSVTHAEWQVLGVQKNYTYCFIDFLKLGSSMADETLAAPLISRMTINEKIRLIKSTIRTLYNECHLKKYDPIFENVFQEIKTTLWFYNAITTMSNGPTWELPKGRSRPNESGIHTAMREFTEETSISSSSYSLTGIKYDYTIYDNKAYHMTYYGAITTGNIHINKAQIDKGEIKDVAWLNVKDLLKYEGGRHMACIVKHFMNNLC